ncbi:NAD(P)/FAD-dependent oxidoreductase [Listeria ilorinensis]|uniref:NAD(P)/FAD-dependent oxidoreductase n=1 Tax=Listeria ilorinensis TaxID=2867439 RepID=UPI001EF6BCF4|nr:FAD-binding oxidoreductase [Listeria ilorinensis]
MEKIAIIGGGIIGASAFYHLSKSGVDVTLFDRRDAGQATRHAAGIICPWLSKRRNKVWYELAKHSAAYYPILGKKLEKQVARSGYKQVGTLVLRDSEEGARQVADLARERRVDAPEIGEIKLLDPAAVKRYFPLVQPGLFGVLVSGGGRADGEQIRTALLQAALQSSHARYVEQEAHLVRKARSEKLELRTGGILTDSFDKVIYAGGAWMTEELARLGFISDLLPQKGQILMLQTEQLDTDNWPVVLPPSSKSIVPFEAGVLMVGATHEKEAGFDLTATKAAREEILAAVRPFLANVDQLQLIQQSVGTRPYTSDFKPFIGQLGDLPLFVAGGLGASGLTTGPYVGRLLSEAVSDKPHALDLQSFDPAAYIKWRQ